SLSSQIKHSPGNPGRFTLLTGDTFVSVCGFVPRYFNSVEDLNSVSEISVVRLVNLVSFNR
ncbi:hypothetical protein ACSIK6_005019, partial [Escherichia coli]